MRAAFSMHAKRIPLKFTQGIVKSHSNICIVATLCDHTHEKKTHFKWFNKIHIICIKIDTHFFEYMHFQ